MTKRVSEEMRELVEEIAALHKPQCLTRARVPFGHAARQAQFEQGCTCGRDSGIAALLSRIAELEADKRRLDELERLRGLGALRIDDTDKTFEVQLFIGKGLWECYASLRDAASGSRRRRPHHSGGLKQWVTG